jgi:hypothetical protein
LPARAALWWQIAADAAIAPLSPAAQTSTVLAAIAGQPVSVISDDVDVYWTDAAIGAVGKLPLP